MEEPSELITPATRKKEEVAAEEVTEAAVVAAEVAVVVAAEVVTEVVTAEVVSEEAVEVIMMTRTKETGITVLLARKSNAKRKLTPIVHKKFLDILKNSFV